MNCKNCDLTLNDPTNFCPDCGAKVVKGRLTFKSLWHEFTEKFFNYDSTFLRTLKHLILKPNDVILGYINGLRKKYLSPASYLTIAITLSGIIALLTKNAINDSSVDLQSFGDDSTGMQQMLSVLMDYQALIFFLYIPTFAIGILVAFYGAHKLSEHFVTAIYCMSQYNIIMFPLNLIGVLFFPDHIIGLGNMASFLIIGYSFYVLMKIYKKNFKLIFLRCILFGLIFSSGYVLAIAIAVISFLITGELDIKSFAPQP